MESSIGFQALRAKQAIQCRVITFHKDTMAEDADLKCHTAAMDTFKGNTAEWARTVMLEQMAQLRTICNASFDPFTMVQSIVMVNFLKSVLPYPTNHTSVSQIATNPFILQQSSPALVHDIVFQCRPEWLCGNVKMVTPVHSSLRLAGSQRYGKMHLLATAALYVYEEPIPRTEYAKTMLTLWAAHMRLGKW